MMLMSMWCAFLVPFFIIMMVVGGSRRPRPTHDSDEEIEMDSTYQGEEEGMEGDGDNEHDSDGQDLQKSKDKHTPLWKYVTKLTGGKGGGTGKFICHHCNTEYTGSYTRVRKHLCGPMYWDEGKNIGIKTCVSIDSKNRLKYQREEEVAQNKTKRPRSEPENAGRMFSGRNTSSHASAFSPSSSPKTLSEFLDQGCRDDVDAKVYRFLYACGIPFNVLRSPYWHEMVQAINGAPKGYRSPGYDKARTVGLDRERAKIQGALGNFTKEWNQHGVSIVSDGWTNVKGKPLINILAVSKSGAIFLSSHDYSDRYKTGINIADALLKTIQEIGPYNVIQVITDNAANCKAAGAIIEDRYPNIFWSGCLVHTMNLLMHDIIKMKDHDYRWIGALYNRGKKMIRFITNHSMAHYIFHSHSKLKLLKIAKARFASYYLTFRRLLKVREALASMASSDSWQNLKNMATSVSERSDFQEVEDTVLDGHFWQQVRYILQFTKPIYIMIRFADTNRPVIEEVYEQMDSILGQIKDIVEPKDAILYDHIHKLVVKRWDNLNVPLHALAYVLTPKYYSSSWLAQPAPRGGERRKLHTNSDLQNGYMLALDKLVPDEEECAQVRSKLRKYISEHGVFCNLHATKDRDRLGAIEWWNMYGSPAKNLHKLAVKVLSHVVNTSFAKRCWSTYSFIHCVKRNNLNADQAKSLVYVHYNLRLLSHYYDAEGNAFCKRDMTWDNNPEETNLQDETIVLERLEEELLGDHDGNHIPRGDMPPPSTTRVPDSLVLPLSAQRPLSRGGHLADGRVPRSLPPVSALIQRSREKKLEVSRGKRKT
jgi:hypothetical protein